MVEAADRMEIEHLFSDDISDENLIAAVEMMESAEDVTDSDELLAVAANRMEMEFLFSQSIPDESLIDAVRRLESDGFVEIAIGDDRARQHGN